MNEKQRLYSIVLGLALLPVIIGGLFAFVISAKNRDRYDPAYFTTEMQAKYQKVGAVAKGLEQAIIAQDESQLPELTGLTQPVSLPDIRLRSSQYLLLSDNLHRKYLTYLYYDSETYERTTQYMTLVDGRWVVSPQDLYFYLDSGRWLLVWLPLALVWWLALLGATIAASIRQVARSWQQPWLNSHTVT